VFEPCDHSAMYSQYFADPGATLFPRWPGGDKVRYILDARLPMGDPRGFRGVVAKVLPQVLSLTSDRTGSPTELDFCGKRTATISDIPRGLPVKLSVANILTNFRHGTAHKHTSGMISRDKN
jgi:hypothetical protein